MTERLYYADPYAAHFRARVAERLVIDGRPAVLLDRSAFYPTGGGQPHDTGVLVSPVGAVEGGVRVVEVVERAEDAAVLHILERPLPAQVHEVEGQLDWPRRFDLMQQHTGQHILSAVFARRLRATTVGFHLSDTYATIDLDRAALTEIELDGVEQQSNAAVFADRPVRARFVGDDELAGLALRKPVVHAGPVRVVEVLDLDLSACGGTHVARTGEVGLIKITRSERRGDESRIEFLCGWRALEDFRAKNRLLLDMSRQLSVGWWEMLEALDRQEQDQTALRRELRLVRAALLDAEAIRLGTEAEVRGELRLVVADMRHLTPDDVKHLAQRLAQRPHTVALLGWSGEDKAQVTFARSDDLSYHMGRLIGRACAEIEGRGGGRPEFAQGGGPRTEGLADALRAARDELLAGGKA